MKAVFVNFIEIRNSFRKFLKNDKKAGIKNAWYFKHIQQNQVQAMDTRAEFLDAMNSWAKQGVVFSKTIRFDKPSKYGACVIDLHVLRAIDDTKVITQGSNLKGEYIMDEVGIACDYLPADCEICIAEVIF